VEKGGRETIPGGGKKECQVHITEKKQKRLEGEEIWKTKHRHSQKAKNTCGNRKKRQPKHKKGGIAKGVKKGKITRKECKRSYDGHVQQRRNWQ